MKRTFLRRWVFAVTAGEAIGFIIPAAVGGSLALAEAPSFVVYPVTILAGACEGILLGLGQSIGFGSSVPRLAWVTAVGAALAWSLGMLPSTIVGFDLGSLSTVLWVGMGAVLLLVSIPTLQWLVLRRAVPGSFRWIPINAGAWAAGILWTVAPSPFIDENTAPPVLLGSYVLAGILMAATVATLTGFAAKRVVLAAEAGRAQQRHPTA